jgi:transcriptional regulator with XRE-family HTH domain
MMACMSPVGTLLRRYREERGLSREAVARAADVSVSMAQRVERFGLMPKLDVAARMARAVGVPAEELLDAALESPKKEANA